MASYDAYFANPAPASLSTCSVDFSVDGTALPSTEIPQGTIFKMTAQALGIWVSWISVGTPDFTGAGYSTPGDIDVLTIGVSQESE